MIFLVMVLQSNRSRLQVLREGRRTIRHEAQHEAWGFIGQIGFFQFINCFLTATQTIDPFKKAVRLLLG
jgi:hypothetical protein